MSDYKNQHFLPASYLETFGIPKTLPARKRKIFRVGKTTHGFVPVDSQCQKDYFYSKSQPQEVETYFQKVERIYNLSIPPIRARYQLSRDQLFNLLLFAADLYARNWKFRIQSEDGNFQPYLKRIEVFKKIILPADQPELSVPLKRDMILKTWDFNIIGFNSENALLTCDCPTHYLGSSTSGDRLKAILLPLTSNTRFVAAERNTYEIRNRIGCDDDAISLNKELIRNASHSVYSPEKLSGDEIEAVPQTLSTKSYISQDETGWALHLVDYDKQPNLPFLNNQMEQ